MTVEELIERLQEAIRLKHTQPWAEVWIEDEESGPTHVEQLKVEIHEVTLR